MNLPPQAGLRAAARPWRRAPAAQRSSRVTSLLLFIALGVALRLQFLGTPVQHIDEQFYLFVADRMADGALPYVDIWDRKPIGLFLIYRAAVALPGDAVLWVQAFGLAAAVGTALVVERIAACIAAPLGARLAGLAYLAFMPVFGCGYAQSPVFYNLAVALAAWLTIRTTLAPGPEGFEMRGAAAMILLGLALQIKYTVGVEGVALGLMLLWHGWRSGLSVPRLALVGLGWMALAALPTALAYAAYSASGHAPQFVHANFLSVFGKTMGDGRELVRIGQAALILSPFAVAALLGPAPPDRAALRRIRVWAVAAIAGYALVGHWYDHYVGPMLFPLSVLTAPMLGATKWYRVLLFGVAALTNLVVGIDRHLNDGTTREAEAAAARIAGELHGGCLYQYQGQAMLYRLTRACIPTRFPFPDHLATAPEGPALGVDPVAETRRIMDSRPAVVMVDDADRPYMENAQTRAVVNQALARSYSKRGQIVLGRFHWGFWVLRR